MQKMRMLGGEVSLNVGFFFEINVQGSTGGSASPSSSTEISATENKFNVSDDISILCISFRFNIFDLDVRKDSQ
jgi:hypothetical protein